MNRYPTRIRLSDPHDWVHRTSKAALALLGLATGALHRVGELAANQSKFAGTSDQVTRLARVNAAEID